MQRSSASSNGSSSGSASDMTAPVSDPLVNEWILEWACRNGETDLVAYMATLVEPTKMTQRTQLQFLFHSVQKVVRSEFEDAHIALGGLKALRSLHNRMSHINGFAAAVAEAKSPLTQMFDATVLQWRRQAVLCCIRTGTFEQTAAAFAEFLPAAASSTDSTIVQNALDSLPPEVALSQQQPDSPLAESEREPERGSRPQRTLSSSLPPLAPTEVAARSELQMMLQMELPRMQDFELKKIQYAAELSKAIQHPKAQPAKPIRARSFAWNNTDRKYPFVDFQSSVDRLLAEWRKYIPPSFLQITHDTWVNHIANQSSRPAAASDTKSKLTAAAPAAAAATTKAAASTTGQPAAKNGTDPAAIRFKPPVPVMPNVPIAAPPVAAPAAAVKRKPVPAAISSSVAAVPSRAQSAAGPACQIEWATENVSLRELIHVLNEDRTENKLFTSPSLPQSEDEFHEQILLGKHPEIQKRQRTLYKR